MNNSLQNYKFTHTRNNSRIPITMTICDSDPQLCPTVNLTENESVIMSKRSPKTPITITNNPNNSTLRINVKEKKNRPIIPIFKTCLFIR
jgi:hypothetical protein